MSLQMRLHAALSGRAWKSAAKVRELVDPGVSAPRQSAAVPHELYQVNHVVRDEVSTADGIFTTHSLVPATDAPRDTPLDICIYLHGGGYVQGLRTAHWRFISEISGAGMNVIVPDYGLAPQFEATAAAHLLDAVYDRAAARAEASGHRLTLVGDSAGAGLALGWLLSRLDDARPTRLDRLALICPWLDATCSSPGTDELVEGDPMLHPDALRVAGEAWGREAGVRSLQVSPLNAPDDLLGHLPPTHVWSGTRDILHADASYLAHRTGCDLTVVKGALHNYPLLSTPEGKAGRADVIRWLQG